MRFFKRISELATVVIGMWLLSRIVRPRPVDIIAVHSAGVATLINSALLAVRQREADQALRLALAMGEGDRAALYGYLTDDDKTWLNDIMMMDGE